VETEIRSDCSLSADKSGSATILSDLALSVFLRPGYQSILGAVWIDLFRVPELYVFLPGPIEHKKKEVSDPFRSSFDR
jgi:hypothetical protein